MNIIGLKFLSNEAKKLVKSVVDLSKKMLKTCLKIQYNAAVFPIYFLYGGLKYIYEQSTSDSENEPSLEPRNDDIVSAVQQLRSSVVSSINYISSSKRDGGTAPITLNGSISNDERQHGDALPEQIPDLARHEQYSTESSDNPQIVPLSVSDFSGCDLMWDVPIISAKAKYFKWCLEEKNIDKIAVARKGLEEYAITNQMPKTRRKYDRMVKDAMNGLEYFSNDAEYRCLCKRDAAATTKLTSNILEKNGQKLESCSDGATSDRFFRRHKNTECVCDPKLIQGRIMRHEIATIGHKLERIHETCSSIMQGLFTLNEHLRQYVSMKEKIAKLEYDVKEGRRLLKEVEYDRSMMETKLLALEELIKEEQQFLFRPSYESGFYETETNERTTDELSAFTNVPNLCTSQNP